MNILFLANIRIPTEKAHGLQIMKTCEALAGAGASVTLAVPTRHNRFSQDPFDYYGVERNFALRTVSTPDWVSRGRLGFLLSLLWFSEAAHSLKEFWAADVVYSRDHLVLLQYVLLGRPFAFEAHQAPNVFSRFVARRARAVVVISEGLKRAYMGTNISAEKIAVAPDAASADFFEAGEDREASKRALGLSGAVALYSGHLYARKGADTFFAAAAALPEVRFVSIGGTAGDVERVRKGTFAPNVAVLGHKPYTEVPRYLRAADVLVIPNSARDADSREFSSPMKLFEYMASGTPIVASDVPAIREVLDEKSCYFVRPDDAGALARGIEKALTDAHSDTKAARAREQAENYTWRVRGKRILSALQHSLK